MEWKPQVAAPKRSASASMPTGARFRNIRHAACVRSCAAYHRSGPGGADHAFRARVRRHMALCGRSGGVAGIPRGCGWHSAAISSFRQLDPRQPVAASEFAYSCPEMPLDAHLGMPPSQTRASQNVDLDEAHALKCFLRSDKLDAACFASIDTLWRVRRLARGLAYNRRALRLCEIDAYLGGKSDA